MPDQTTYCKSCQKRPIEAQQRIPGFHVPTDDGTFRLPCTYHPDAYPGPASDEAREPADNAGLRPHCRCLLCGRDRLGAQRYHRSDCRFCHILCCLRGTTIPGGSLAEGTIAGIVTGVLCGLYLVVMAVAFAIAGPTIRAVDLQCCWDSCQHYIASISHFQKERTGKRVSLGAIYFQLIDVNERQRNESLRESVAFIA
jgi:hypothetical protein